MQQPEKPKFENLPEQSQTVLLNHLYGKSYSIIVSRKAVFERRATTKKLYDTLINEQTKQTHMSLHCSAAS